MQCGRAEDYLGRERDQDQDQRRRRHCSLLAGRSEMGRCSGHGGGGGMYDGRAG